MSTESHPLTHEDAASQAASIIVEICDTQAFLPVNSDRLVSLVRHVLVEEGIVSAMISLVLVDNAVIQRINCQHLGHDWPTDVISFVLSGPDDPELAGELVISTEMALATAREIGADPLAELALYTVHGLLHLCGCDDLTDGDVQEMREREDRALRNLGLTNTFALAERFRPFSDQRERAPWSG